MKEKPDFSVVVPVYRCGLFLVELHSRLQAVFSNLNSSFELILVNDGCPENSWQQVLSLTKYKEVIGISLSRNFGQHVAITAGLDQAIGAWIIVMDGDLQDQPEEIPKLFQKAKDGFDIVFARRVIRKDNFLKQLASQAFYKVLGYLTDTVQDASIANFGIYSRKVIDAVCSMREKEPFFPVMTRWVGFRSTAIDVNHAPRASGASSYTLKKLMNLALNTLFSFSDKPLRLMVLLGILISFLSFVWGTIVLVRILHGYTGIMGWPSIFVSLWFFSGLLIVLIGLVGLYVGGIFREVKDRPLYFIDEISGYLNGSKDEL